MSVAQAPLIYLGAPSKPGALRRIAVPASFRKFLQGAGTAMLGYAGADSVVGPADAANVPTLADYSSIDGILQGALAGQFTGPAQLAAAFALFVLAGKSNWRMIGLFAGLAGIYLYSQGVTLADATAFAESFLSRLSAGTEAFLSTPAT